MTPPAQLKIGEQLDRLCLALATLDHQTVETCCGAVSALLPGLNGAVGPRQVSEIRSKLFFARTLTENASRLYGGWARLAALHGAAYTTTGDEPSPTAASSVKVEG